MCGAVCGGLGCTALWHSAAFKKKKKKYRLSPFPRDYLSFWVQATEKKKKKSTWSDLFFK